MRSVRARKLPSSSQHPPILSTPVIVSPITILPTEILDQILSYYFERQLALDEKCDGAKLSLVCRAWSRLAQRHLFRSVICVVGRLDEFSVFAKAESDLASSVRSFELKKMHGQELWTVAQLYKCLALLTTITSLSIYLGARPAGHSGDFSRLATIPHLSNLKHLTIATTFYESQLKLQRVLLGTRSIQSLTLRTYGKFTTSNWLGPTPDHGTSGTLPFGTKITPLDLPSLTKLSIWSEDICASFEKLQIFSKSTLERLTDLGLSHRLSDNLSKTQLRLIGPKLQRLQLGVDFYMRHHVEDMLGVCPHLEFLSLYPPLGLDHLPPSLHTINYFQRNQNKYPYWISLGSGVKRTWTHVKRIEVDGMYRIDPRFAENCVAQGIEVDLTRKSAGLGAKGRT